MSIVKPSSQVTFLYFEKIQEAADFFEGVLGLERVMDTGWAYVWRTAGKAFVGAVDEKHTSLNIDVRGGVLVSLTVDNIEEVHKHLVDSGVKDVQNIYDGQEIPIRSVFCTGPAGYKFEIQQFTSPELIELFG